jgi:hypothetical protein
VSGLALTVRSHRSEVIGAGMVGLLALVGALFVASHLALADIPITCFGAGGPECLGMDPRIGAYREFARQWGYVALGGLVLLPIIPGLILGIALVGKEIDRGTAVFAWSLAPSRRRWFLTRAMPIGTVIVAASLAGGFLGDWLEALRDPGVDPGGTFEHMGIRGWPVAGMALAAFGLALACGAIFGRILPALLLAIVLTGATWAAVNVGTYALLSNETVYVPGVDGGPTGPIRWRVVDYLIVAPTGEILTWQQAYERYGDPGVLTGPDAAVQLGSVLAVNPGQMYPLVAARMALLYGVVGLAASVLAVAEVDRRRP